MIRNIIFDWSGTLVDDLAAVLQATNSVFADYGRSPLSLDEFRTYFRLPFAGFYAEFLPEATAGDLETLYERFFSKLHDNIPLLPGAREILDFCLATQRRTFLLSTIKVTHFETQATRLGLRDAFEHPYVQVMDKREKIREILAIHHLNPDETLFIGDMVHDIETAHHARILGAAVLTGFDPIEKLVRAQPSIIVPNLSILQQLLS